MKAEIKSRPPLPPFTEATARQKLQAALLWFARSG